MHCFFRSDTGLIIYGAVDGGAGFQVLGCTSQVDKKPQLIVLVKHAPALCVCRSGLGSCGTARQIVVSALVAGETADQHTSSLEERVHWQSGSSAARMTAVRLPGNTWKGRTTGDGDAELQIALGKGWGNPQAEIL